MFYFCSSLISLRDGYLVVCGVEMDDERLTDLIRAAAQSEVSVDVLEILSRNLDARAFAIFIGNASYLPRYIKSSDNP